MENELYSLYFNCASSEQIKILVDWLNLIEKYKKQSTKQVASILTSKKCLNFN